MDRVELIDHVMVNHQLEKGVEVGSFKGDYAVDILKKWDGHLFMVDVWTGLGEEYNDANNHNRFENPIYVDCVRNVERFGFRATMIRTKSEIGSELFADNSIDFVYIDANHAYDFVKQDISLWYPKVKPGGFLMGHDYLAIDWDNDTEFEVDENGKDKHIYNEYGYCGSFGVNPAVDEFCQASGHNLKITDEPFWGSWYIQK